MACVTSVSYSICINGDIYGWFRGKRGLRQGDPMSPDLFNLVMEVLALLLLHRVEYMDGFQYHNLCEKQKIVNFCFIDDLFLFTHGDVL